MTKNSIIAASGPIRFDRKTYTWGMALNIEIIVNKYDNNKSI